MKRKIFIYFGIFLFIFFIISILGKKKGWFGGDFKYKVSTEFPQKRTIVETIGANGKIQPETEVKISADVSGEVVELYVKEGDEVKQGDLLAKIKPDTYLSATERMEASLNSSKSNLANSKARLTQIQAQFKQIEQNYLRNKKLYEQGVISQAEFESIQSQYDMSKSDVEATDQNVKASLYQINSAAASLKEANANLQKTSIYAPFSGTISLLNIEKGERVVGTMQMAGTEILRIANLHRMEVLADVSENDIVKVKIGDTAWIEVDAYLPTKFKGIVTRISNSTNGTSISTQSSRSDQVTNYQVNILILANSYEFLNENKAKNFYPFRPGMSASVDIITKIKTNVLSVPIQSVTTRGISDSIKNLKSLSKSNTEMLEVLYIYENGISIEKEVKTGLQDDNFIEILSGIAEKDEIITGPYLVVSKKLNSKTQVQKTAKEESYKQTNDK